MKADNEGSPIIIIISFGSFDMMPRMYVSICEEESLRSTCNANRL